MILSELLKTVDESRNVDVYDTTESDWHRTLYEGPVTELDTDEVSAMFPGRDTHVADEEVLDVYEYEDGVCIGLANGTAR